MIATLIVYQISIVLRCTSYMASCSMGFL